MSRHIQVPAWAPIATAPQDPGRRLLIHFADTDCTYVGFWRGDFGWATINQANRCWCNERSGQPTHWMELPPPPDHQLGEG